MTTVLHVTSAPPIGRSCVIVAGANDVARPIVVWDTQDAGSRVVESLQTRAPEAVAFNR